MNGGWYDDPTGRFEKRYAENGIWTSHVANGAHTGNDPLPAPPPTTVTASGSLPARTTALVLAGAVAVVVLVIGVAVVLRPGPVPTGVGSTPLPSTPPTLPLHFPAVADKVDMCSLLSEESVVSLLGGKATGVAGDFGDEELFEHRCGYERGESFVDVSFTKSVFSTNGIDNTPVDSVGGTTIANVADGVFLNASIIVTADSAWDFELHLVRHDLPADATMVPAMRAATVDALQPFVV